MVKYIIPFILGVLFLFAATFQSTNTIYKRWKAAFITSLIISACSYVQIKYVSNKETTSFILFALGAAFGSSLGNIFGNKLGSSKND